MFAIVKINGNQFKVQPDQHLFIPRLSLGLGEKMEIKDVLLVENNGQVLTGSSIKSVVQAEVVKHLQGDKVIAFKMKRRKGFRKKKGHRTQFTEIKIMSIQ